MKECVATDRITDSQGRELQVHGELAFPCAVYEAKDMGFPWHWHDEIEMIYVRSGSLVIAAGSERFDVTAGDAVFVNASVPHALFPKDQTGYEEYDIVFHPKLIYGNTDSLLWQKYILPICSCTELQGLHFPASPFSAHVLQACLAFEEKQDLYEFVVRRELEGAFLEAWKLYSSRCNVHLATENPVSSRVKNAMCYMERNMGNALSLEEIAGTMNVSIRACQRDFKAYLGTSPIQFLAQARLSKAASLLLSTDNSITDICFECGFNDPSNFARQFKHSYGRSPREYRKSPMGE